MDSEQREYDENDRKYREMFQVNTPQDWEMKSEEPTLQDPGLKVDTCELSAHTQDCENLFKIEKVPVKKREMKNMIKYRSSINPSKVYELPVEPE
jgi:hypothetical protein